MHRLTVAVEGGNKSVGAKRSGRKSIEVSVGERRAEEKAGREPRGVGTTQSTPSPRKALQSRILHHPQPYWVIIIKHFFCCTRRLPRCLLSFPSSSFSLLHQAVRKYIGRSSIDECPARLSLHTTSEEASSTCTAYLRPPCMTTVILLPPTTILPHH